MTATPFGPGRQQSCIVQASQRCPLCDRSFKRRFSGCGITRGAVLGSASSCARAARTSTTWSRSSTGRGKLLKSEISAPGHVAVLQLIIGHSLLVLHRLLMNEMLLKMY